MPGGWATGLAIGCGCTLTGGIGVGVSITEPLGTQDMTSVTASPESGRCEVSLLFRSFVPVAGCGCD